MSLTAPTYIGKSAFASGTAALTVGTVSGYQQGDFLLLVCEGASNFSKPSGWTLIDSAYGSSSVQGWFFYKFASASEGNTIVSDSGDHNTAQIFCFRGVDRYNPIAHGVFGATISTSLSFPAIRTPVENCMIVLAAATDRDLTSSSTFSSWTNANLSNLTERGDDTTSSGAGGGFGVATGVLATAGSTGTSSCTQATAVAAATKPLALIPSLPTTVGGSAPQVIGVTHTFSGNVTLNPPSGVQEGDLLIAFGYFSCSTNTSWCFAEAYDGLGTTAYRYAGASSNGITTAYGYFGMMICIRGGMIPDFIAAGSTIPAAVTRSDNSLVINMLFGDATTSPLYSNWTNTSLTSITERLDVYDATTTAGMGVVTGVDTVAGSVNATTVTISSGDIDYALTIVVPPVEPSASSNPLFFGSNI